MKLLGEWNWYLPRRLEWLPRFAHEPRVPSGVDDVDAESGRHEPVRVLA